MHQSSPLQRWQTLRQWNPVCNENASVLACVCYNAFGVPFWYRASRPFQQSISTGSSSRPPSGMLSMGSQKSKRTYNVSIILWGSHRLNAIEKDRLQLFSPRSVDITECFLTIKQFAGDTVVTRSPSFLGFSNLSILGSWIFSGVSSNSLLPPGFQKIGWATWTLKKHHL